jgi:two-component system OmpR family sensor kinase
MSSEAEPGAGKGRGRRAARRLNIFARLSIRWRLALASAGLTLAILMSFAVVVGALTSRQVKESFVHRVEASANDLAQNIAGHSYLAPYMVVDRHGLATIACPDFRQLSDLAITEHAVIRYMTLDGVTICTTPANAPELGSFSANSSNSQHVGSYEVEYRNIPVVNGNSQYGGVLLQYARSDDEVGQTQARVRLFLIFGVVAGTVLALLAGLAIARRAMRPISQLTERASEIERTRDPRGRVPHPAADDEVAELARTLERMLMALDAARRDTESSLHRQREFVADASHELRTPLTSVLANLEMLADHLSGEQHEIAAAALRSSRRMRRLVADLLLLARADAGRTAARAPVDLGDVLSEAAGELGPVSDGHDLRVDPHPIRVEGVRDELHRLILNLLENAIRHTPRGTEIRGTVQQQGGVVRISVEDDGPGIAPELQKRIFERFVRAGGERAGSSGLGLAIVRAVALSHGGDVRIERSASGGARFVVELPALVGDQARPAVAPAGTPV